MPKTYKLAILADTTEQAIHNSVLRYTTITASSHENALQIADQIGALVCGWSLAR